MCGIVGYSGKSEALPIILGALERLEYRGYDSAGVALQENGNLFVEKEVGKIRELIKTLWGRPLKSTCGIGHTRWATHGAPSKENAHPHTDEEQTFALVHNGIIENYLPLKKALQEKGYNFKSQTDTEIIVYLIKDNFKGDLLEAVLKTVEKLEGSFAFALISKYEKNKIIGVKKGSPLIVGLSKDENFLASDIPAILPYTKQIVTLNDEEIAELTDKEVLFYDFNGNMITKHSIFVPWDIVSAEKLGYKHFMLKEIFEQPRAVSDTIRGFLSNEFEINFSLKDINRIVITACGSSYNAGLYGKYVLEKYSNIPVEIGYASEQRYESIPINENTLAIAISQSGETADTRFAIQKFKEKGAKVLSIVNIVGSSLDRESDYSIYTHAGPEIGVAATKTFTAQLVALYALSILIAKEIKQIDETTYLSMLEEMISLPTKIENVLSNQDIIKEISSKFLDAKSVIFLGRGLSFPIALEGALKLKEISYIHAEGFAAGEMKHGPIALIDDKTPIVFIAPKDFLYEKSLSNLEEVIARNGKVFSIISKNDKTIKEKSLLGSFEIEHVRDEFYPILTVIPLQLLAYYVASELGLDVDQPRNLAKTVTVE